MKAETRETKKRIKDMAPSIAIERIERYKIPSPYKEILIVTCVQRKKQFEALHFLSEHYGINLGFWAFGEKLQTALKMFAESENPKKYPEIPQEFFPFGD